MIKRLVKHGKTVAIFKDHNLAPIAWRDATSLDGSPPALLTLDHHTDTHIAFLRHIYQSFGNGMPIDIKSEVLIKEAKRLSLEHAQSMDADLSQRMLRNDEHIDFAIRAGIISHANVISRQTNAPFVIRSAEYTAWFKEKNHPRYWIGGVEAPPRPADITYELPENRILSFDNDAFQQQDLKDERSRLNVALEDSNLTPRLQEIQHVNRALFGRGYDFTQNFILDIDLDYFNTRRSIEPTSSAQIRNLIRQAKMITIATEDDFVLSCQMDGENLSATYLLDKLIAIIDSALNPE